jgi:hypothetical protein
MTDDIRDLLGRYATGSLTAEERKRLFEAALDDQDLFEELAREDEMKELLAGPGVRQRLIRALEPPKRKVPWVLALAPVAVLSALLMVILMRPVPKPPQQVAVLTPPAPPAVNAPSPQPSGVPVPLKRRTVARSPEQVKEEDTNGVKKDLDSRAADQKEAAPKEAAPKIADQVAPAPPAAPAPQTRTQTVEVQAQASQVQVQGLAGGQQNAPGGPKQNAVQAARAMVPARSKIATIAQGFGFHYSIQTPGHLVVIPLAEGYLSVKSPDGGIIFAPQRIAAGISTDIVLSDSVHSLTIQFSADANPSPVPSTARTESAGTAQALAGGPSAVAIELRINP